MSADIINYLRKTNADQATVDRIIQILHEQHPEIKGDAKTVKKLLASNIRKRTSSLITGTIGLNRTEVNGGQFGVFSRKITGLVNSYPLLHTITGTPVMEMINGTKFNSGGINDATKHITTVSDSMMDMGSGSFGIALWYKSTSTVANHGIICKRNIATTTNQGFDIYVATGNTIELRISDGANTTLCSKSFGSIHDGLWHSIICNIPSAGNLEIFGDGSSLGTTARGSVGSVTNSRDCYEMARDNAGTIQEKLNGSIAWFAWKTGIFSSQQITDWQNALYDSTNEVIFRPYNANWDAEPNMTSGLFQSGT